jgi:hypothetical protein
MSHFACPRLALGAALASVLAASPTAPDSADEWQDPTVSGRNREPAHATMLPYATVEQALEGTREASPFFRSLNTGRPATVRWPVEVHYVAKPADRPRDFHRATSTTAAGPRSPCPPTGSSRATTGPST